MQFTYSGLYDFLMHCKSLGDVIPFRDYNNTNSIILRHDIDFDVDMACKVAKVEIDAGVRSTFFFMTTCDTYNILSIPNRKKIKEIAELGFEIGLHFDPTVYDENDVDALERYVKEEAGLIENIIGEEVKTVSLHNPSVHGQYPIFKQFINAYDLNFFNDSKYLSDSRFLFSGKDPYEFVKQVKDSVVQVLLHPMHYHDKEKTYPEIFADYILCKIDKIEEAISVNSTYVKQIDSKGLRDHILGTEKS